MAFVVLFDACVLYPAPQRDLLLRLAGTGLFRARWTEEILDECFAAILRERPDLDAANLARTRQRMNEAVPNCIVRNYGTIAAALELPDPSDRHVLAAAIRAGAQVIVTSNLSDFPAETLAEYDMVAQHPDDFLLHVLDLSPVAFLRVLDEQAGALRAPPMSVEDVLLRLESGGITSLAAEVRKLRRG